MSTRSAWATLDVPATATAAEIKRAYRQKPLELHPDRGGDAEAFRALHQAYQSALKRLGQPEKKRRRRR